MGLSGSGVSQSMNKPQATTPTNGAASNVKNSGNFTLPANTNNVAQETTSASRTSSSSMAKIANDMMSKYSSFTPPTPSNQQQDQAAMMAQMAAMQGQKAPQMPQMPQGNSSKSSSPDDSVKNAIRAIAKDQSDFKKEIGEQVAKLGGKKGESKETPKSKDISDLDKALEGIEKPNEAKESKVPEAKLTENYDPDNGVDIEKLV